MRLRLFVFLLIAVAATTMYSSATAFFSPVIPISFFFKSNDSLIERAREERVPVLCYHQIRPWNNSDGNTAKTYITPETEFSDQMKALHDSGYHSILPEQLIAHLKAGTALPSKPIMITFDDGTASQYENALPVLTKYGFKAVFFIMTVSMGKPKFMTKTQIATLSAQGHVIGAHTWDHKNVKKYTSNDWEKQIKQPKKALEDIVGKPVVYFAYPFGVWSYDAVAQLAANSYVAAFQLAGTGDEKNNLFTINRILVDGHWRRNNFIDALKR